MQPATLKFYVHHAVLKCENGTVVIVKSDFACRLNSPPSCAPGCLHAVMNLAGLQNLKKLNPDFHLCWN